MRAVFGSRDERLRDGAPRRCSSSSAEPSVLVLAVLGGKRANQAVFDRVRAPIDALLGELITARRADPDLDERDRHPLAAARRHRHGRRDALATSC